MDDQTIVVRLEFVDPRTTLYGAAPPGSSSDDPVWTLRREIRIPPDVIEVARADGAWASRHRVLYTRQFQWSRSHGLAHETMD